MRSRKKILLAAVICALLALPFAAIMLPVVDDASAVPNPDINNFPWKSYNQYSATFPSDGTYTKHHYTSGLVSSIKSYFYRIDGSSWEAVSRDVFNKNIFVTRYESTDVFFQTQYNRTDVNHRLNNFTAKFSISSPQYLETTIISTLEPYLDVSVGGEIFTSAFPRHLESPTSHAYSVGGVYWNSSSANLIDISDLPDGVYTSLANQLQLRAYQGSGSNLKIEDLRVPVIIDTTAPHIVSSYPADGSYIGTEDVEVTWEAYDAIAGVEKFEYKHEDWEEWESFTVENQ